jgi:hypothetical protein
MIIDLSKYKVAWFEGDCIPDLEMSMDQIMLCADKDALPDLDKGRFMLALIPKKASLTQCGGDDWNDTPAYCNASGFYRYPRGTIILRGRLGGELKRRKP